MGRLSRYPLPAFLFFSPSLSLSLSLFAGGHSEQFWHGQGCPLFDVVRPAFSLPTTASPYCQDALQDGFGEVVGYLMFS